MKRIFHQLIRNKCLKTNRYALPASNRTLSFVFLSLFPLLVLFCAGAPCAYAEDTRQPETSPTTTYSRPVSSETITPQDPASPAAQQRPIPAQAHEPAAQTAPAVHLGPQVDPCISIEVAGDNWMDQVHDFVQDNTCEPAVWFDTFFVKDHVLLDLRPGMLIILRNSARWTEGQGVINIFDYHLEWKLPQWKRYLKKSKLYFESRSVADKYTAQPGQPVQPGVNRETGVRQPIIGVRADLYSKLDALVTIDTGVKIGIHSNAHIRMRYQYVKPFREVYLFRFSEIAMWQFIERFTNTTQLDLERKFTTFTFVRWGNNVTYTEGTAGVTWNTGVSLFTQLSQKSAISYDTSMWGVNHPDWVIQNYRIGSLYRRNFYRPWLFLELSPEVTWPKAASGQREPVYAFMATLEIQFGK